MRQRDDIVLAQRVENEIFRDEDVPKGAIYVNAENGRIILRGEVNTPELLRDLEERAAKVQGVTTVENRLQLQSAEAETTQKEELVRALQGIGRDVAPSLEPTRTETAHPASGTSMVKVTVNLPEGMAAVLRDLAKQEGKSFTQALKEAISLKLFVADVIDQGGKLLIEYPDKTVERIVFGLEPRMRQSR